MLAVRQHVLLGVDWPDVNTGYRYRVPGTGSGTGYLVPGPRVCSREYVGTTVDPLRETAVEPTRRAFYGGCKVAREVATQ